MNRSEETTQAVYNFIQAYHKENRKPLTIREIASGCFVSVGTVIRHLDKLEVKGCIEREPNRARSIVLVKDDEVIP